MAYLAYRWRDIAAAEDALSEAFASALATWPTRGVPSSPEAWLLTAAQRNLAQVHRHLKVTLDPAVIAVLGESDGNSNGDGAGQTPLPPDAPFIPDDRLKLLFVCAHPAIDASVRSALMLQTVMGIEAASIASAFLSSPSAMAQRLVRAKKKIAQTGLRFEVPGESELPERTHAVLEAIYAAYFLGSSTQAGEAPQANADLREEAIYLADLAATLLPQSPEAAGLLALLLLCESRQSARLNAWGEFVPLAHQDTTLWDDSLIHKANHILQHASRAKQAGPFQLEAAIQAAHCQRKQSNGVPWPAIAALYERLLALSSTTGARVGHAVALGEASGLPSVALQALAGIPDQDVVSYQPFWAAKAHFEALQLQAQGPTVAHGLADRMSTGSPHLTVATVKASYARAIGLTSSDPVRRYLYGQMADLDNLGVD